MAGNLNDKLHQAVTRVIYFKMKRASPKSPSKLSNYRLFRLIGLDSINSGHRNEDTTSQRMSESSTSEDEWSSVCDSDSDLMAIDDVGTRHQKIKTFLQADEAVWITPHITRYLVYPWRCY